MILNHKVEAFVCPVNSGSAHFSVIHPFFAEGAGGCDAVRGWKRLAQLLSPGDHGRDGGEGKRNKPREVAQPGDCLTRAREGGCSQAFVGVGACFSSNHYREHEMTHS